MASSGILEEARASTNGISHLLLAAWLIADDPLQIVQVVALMLRIDVEQFQSILEVDKLASLRHVLRERLRAMALSHERALVSLR